MAIGNYYVDPAIAANSGSGTIGDPYGDLQYALNTISQGVDGDQINIKAGTAEILTTTLSLATYGAPTNAQQLHFRGYSSTAGDGGIGEISANGGAFRLVNDTGAGYIHMSDLKVGNNTGTYIWNMAPFSSAFNCEFHTGNYSLGLVKVAKGCAVMKCHVHGNSNGSGTLLHVPILSDGYIICGNYLMADNGKAIDVETQCDGGRIIGNVISVEATAIQNDTGQTVVIMSNSIYCRTTTASVYGIDLRTAGTGQLYATENIIEGFNGTSNYAIRGPTSGDASYIIANNVFFDNTATILTTDDTIVEENNYAAASSPFKSASNEDFTPTTEAEGNAYVPSYYGAPLSVNSKTAGAFQANWAGWAATGIPITMPTAPEPRRFEWIPVASVASSSNPSTFQPTVYDWGGKVRRVRLEYPPMKLANAKAWQAFFCKLNGGTGTFYLSDTVGKSGRGTVTGNPMVNGSGQTGNQLQTDGWETGDAVKAGDWISICHRLYSILQDASETSGAMTITVWPDVDGVKDNETIMYGDDARGVFRLDEFPTFRWDVGRTQASFTLVATEEI